MVQHHVQGQNQGFGVRKTIISSLSSPNAPLRAIVYRRILLAGELFFKIPEDDLPLPFRSLEKMRSLNARVFGHFMNVIDLSVSICPDHESA